MAATPSGWSKERIRAGLVAKGLTLRGLATANGLYPGSVSAALIRPYVSAERVIADALGVEPQELWPDRYLRKRRNSDEARTAALPAISTRCPHCEARCVCIRSRQVTSLYREITYECRGCEFVFVASITPVRTLTPSKKPNPSIIIPSGERS